jgi:phosphatidylglycerol lysyltransferase
MTARHIRRAISLAATVLGVIDLVVTALRVSGPRAETHGLAAHFVHAVVGVRYLLPFTAVTLLWVSRGLLHAKRNAWRIAVLASAASAVACRAHRQDLLGVVPSLVLLVALVLGRRWFAAPADPARPRDALRLLGIGGVVVYVSAATGLYFLDSQFRVSTTALQSMREAARAMVLLPVSTIDPATIHGRWLLESIRVGVLLVVLAAATRLIAVFVLRPGVPGDRRLVGQLLAEWGDTALASFHLLDDKHWFFGADRRAFVGYVLVGRTALALGEPVGHPDALVDTARDFVEFCETNGWTAAFHQVTERGANVLAAAALRVAKIGEEAVVAVQTWSLDGAEHKSLRSAVRRVERAGFEVVELAQPLDEATMADLARVSDRWMADGSHRERTFTVGRFDPAYLRSTTVLAVRERGGGRIVAFTNVLPSYHSSDATFDLMRRDPDAPNGVMEYLFVALIARFRAAGNEGMNLGFAPMANITGDTVLDRTMRLAFERGERLFNYQGLRRFKDKWSPRWEPRFLGYRTESDLPKVALAVMRAGELPDPRSKLARVAQVGRRLPATLTLGALVVWFMAVTNNDEQDHRDLLRNIGLSWRDLTHFQLWRLPTAQLVETSAGFVWSNIALFICVLPLAEWVFGTRRTVLVFFLGDWFSTLSVLVVLRIASVWNHHAAVLLQLRDGGPSSGAWALAVTLAFAVTDRTTRIAVVTGVLAFLSFALVVHDRLFDVQHFLAAMAAVAGVWWVHRRGRRVFQGPELGAGHEADQATGRRPASEIR